MPAEQLVATAVVELNAKGEPICGAPNRRGKRCHQAAGHGTDHPGFGRCKFHLGATKSAGVAAARAEAEQYVENMRKLGQVEEGVSADDALLREVSRAEKAVEYFDEQVAQLKPDELTGAHATKMLWHWNDQRRILAQVSRIVVQAGIARRSIEIQEMQATAMMQAIMYVITAAELNLSPEQQVLARRMTAAKLRELAASPEQQDAMQRIINNRDAIDVAAR